MSYTEGPDIVKFKYLVLPANTLADCIVDFISNGKVDLDSAGKAAHADLQNCFLQLKNGVSEAGENLEAEADAYWQFNILLWGKSSEPGEKERNAILLSYCETFAKLTEPHKIDEKEEKNLNGLIRLLALMERKGNDTNYTEVVAF